MKKKKTPPHHHLITAFRNWMLENFDVVHLHVDATKIGDPFLAEFASDGIVSLNVTDRSISGFYSGPEAVMFSARFSGMSRNIAVEPTAVVGLLGFVRDGVTDSYYAPLPEWDDTSPEPTTKKKPTLSVVK